jgi:hypothetical protein
MTDKADETPNHEARMTALESEMRGLKKFVTTLESGHENRAKDWNRKLAALVEDVDGLQERVRKTRKKVRKLAR